MISDRLRKVILKELKLDSWDIRPEMVASEVPGWDSLSHVRILTAIEDAFGITIKTREALRLKTIGDLQTLIASKSSA